MKKFEIKLNNMKFLGLLSIIISYSLSSINCYERKIVCYWSRGNSVENIDPHLCTHIHYSFAALDSSTLLISFRSNGDEEVVKQINGLKAVNPNLKHILVVGGYAERFSRMANSASSRVRFVEQSVVFLTKYGFNGLDLDWEYPVCPHVDCAAGHTYDKLNFAKLLTELRDAFNKINNYKLSLSAAVIAGQWLADKAYDYNVLNSTLDYLSIMTYDRAGMWENKAWHHADYEWAKRSWNWWATHITKSKLITGIPFYGITFTLKDMNQRGMGAPVTASDSLTYLQICTNVKNNGWIKEYIHPYGPIAYKRNQWVGYDDANRVMQKAQFARENGFGGVMIWEINQDDMKGTCCTTDRPLLRAVNYGLLQRGADPSTYQCE